jgi:hypothetical protein
MQTKPYNLQAPEDIAKEYGGNKQKIAKAAQMGLLDPTAAVLAGMFIDRIRGAQAQEQVPQQTVAQQTFAPMQGPQQALGATPQAPQMAAMQQQMAPRPGIAGVNQIPTNPNMMPSAAGGGLVAFAAGDRVSGGMSEEDRARLERENFKYLKNYNENVVPRLQAETDRLLGDLDTVPFSMSQDEFAGLVGLDLSGYLEDDGERTDVSQKAQQAEYDSFLRMYEKQYRDGEISRDELERRAAQKLEEYPLAKIYPIRPEFTPERRDTVVPDPTARGIAGIPAPIIEAPKRPMPGAGMVGNYPADVYEPPVRPNLEPERRDLVVPTDRPEMSIEDILNNPPTLEPPTINAPSVKAEGPAAVFEEIVAPEDTTDAEMNALERRLGEADDRYNKFLEGEAEAADKAKSDALNTSLIEFGGRLAASKSPYFLQAVGEAATETVPSIREAAKDAIARTKDAEEKLALNEVAKRQEKINLLKIASEKATGERKLQLQARMANEEMGLKQYIADQSAATQKIVADMYSSKQPADLDKIDYTLQNMKDLREQGDSRFKGMTDQQLTRMAIEEAAYDPAAEATKRLAEQRFKMDARGNFNDAKVKAQEALIGPLRQTAEGAAYAKLREVDKAAAERWLESYVLTRNPELVEALDIKFLSPEEALKLAEGLGGTKE